ncbi:Sperm surface protein Sp17 [Camelus dromedarius]|uniref:Sperm surface protein Sp17 n=1 Tax=Camelus dromedarius TaxID=9838 RepID=A0A5N4C7A7_CAMDR|nr:Sperm surface protein Sp17 [Camelus dromedarius]
MIRYDLDNSQIYIYFNELKINLKLLYFCYLETNFDPAEWGTKVDDRFYNNHAFKTSLFWKHCLFGPLPSFQEQEPPEKCPPGKEKSQTSMKEETSLKSSEEDKDKQKAAVKIQAAFRGHLARQEVKKMKLGDGQENKRQESK